MTHRPGLRVMCVSVVAAVAIAGGCGAGGETAGTPQDDDTARTAAVALPAAAVEAGGPVRPAPGTPARVTRALEGNRVVVVAFLMDGPADDAAVDRALRSVRADAAYRRAADFFVYRVGARAAFGDLADHLGVTGTPAVAVIGRDRRLTNRFTAPVDAAMIRQAINDASATAALTPIP